MKADRRSVREIKLFNNSQSKESLLMSCLLDCDARLAALFFWRVVFKFYFCIIMVAWFTLSVLGHFWDYCP